MPWRLLAGYVREKAHPRDNEVKANPGKGRLTKPRKALRKRLPGAVGAVFLAGAFVFPAGSTFTSSGVPLVAPSEAQDLARRLILKDGSYQLVTKYEVKGDRVHYFSAERDEWEELPASLVDWAATDKYEKDRAAGAAVPEAVQLDKEIENEREMETAKLPEVAPGLRLPEDSGIFLLDSFQGEAQLDEIQQTAGDVNRSGRGIFRNPMTAMKQSIEIEGAHALVQSHVQVPALYIKVEADQPAQDTAAHVTPQKPQQPVQPIVPFDRFRLVRAEVKNDRRVLGDVKRQTSSKDVIKTSIDSVTGGWLKLTPVNNLSPGEYVLLEVTQDTGGKEGLNLYVWDFGVNPKAPANANPWKSDKPASTPTDAAKPSQAKQ